MSCDRELTQKIRLFNRTYTNVLGLLDHHLLGGEHSLAEVRILFELSHRALCTATELSKCLLMDKGYLSRILTKLVKEDLIYKSPSTEDKRIQLLDMTAKGSAYIAEMDSRSNKQILSLIEPLSKENKEKLFKSISSVQRIITQEPLDKKKVTIRHNIKPGDIGQIISMHGRLYAQEFGYGLSFEGYVAETFFEFINHYDPINDRIWIAEYERELIGTIAVVGKGETALLRWFLLDPAFRGLGLGKQLINDAIDYCKNKGFKNIELGTAGDLKAALSLYKKLGFEIISQSENHQWRNNVVEIEMRMSVEH